MLDAASMIAEAEARAGIADSEPRLRANLDHLVASLNNEARLPPRGEASARKSLVDRTADRLEVDEWHRSNPKGARGSNPYALETYGLNADAVAEQFSDYMRRFDIPREREGLQRGRH